MRRGIATFVLIGLAAGTASGVNGATVVGCSASYSARFPNAPDVVYLVDGWLHLTNRLQSLDPESIESIRIVCPPELYRRYGIEAKSGGVSIRTNATTPGPAEAKRVES